MRDLALPNRRRRGTMEPASYNPAVYEARIAFVNALNTVASADIDALIADGERALIANAKGARGRRSALPRSVEALQQCVDSWTNQHHIGAQWVRDWAVAQVRAWAPTLEGIPAELHETAKTQAAKWRSARRLVRPGGAPIVSDGLFEVNSIDADPRMETIDEFRDRTARHYAARSKALESCGFKSVVSKTTLERDAIWTVEHVVRDQNYREIARAYLPNEEGEPHKKVKIAVTRMLALLELE